MRRRVLQLIVAIMVSGLPLVAAITPARADNASVLLGMVNALRAAHGVGPLYADPILTRVAQTWSAHMASGYGLVHNPALATEVGGGWTKLGENIGAGSNMGAVYNAFVNSAFHLGNMIDPSYNLTGIAVAVGAGNTLWVTEDFEAKPGATPVTTRPPTTTATTTRTTIPVAPARPVAASPATTSPAPSPPAAAAPVSVPATHATTTVAGTSPVPASDSAGTTPVPSTSGSSVPGKLAAAASLSPPKAAPGSLPSWVLALSLLAVASVAGATYFMRKRLDGQ